ncbi:MAG: hypothetical protein JXQ93_13455 [Flavobacteriaceae bacterium]
MDIYNLVLGILLIALGFLFIYIREYIIRKHQSAGYSSKLGLVGIGAIILGIILILGEII